MANVIYTYYEDVPEISGQQELLELWAYSWYRFGWSPKILSQQHAGCHPHYEKNISEWKKLPSGNYLDYDMACYKRWLALGAVGGGIMVDYDVCNNGFPVDHPICSDPAELIILANGGVPCAVRATSQACLKIASWFQYEPEVFTTAYGKPHVSDMLFFQHHAKEAEHRPLCLGLSEAGASSALMIHFSHSDVSNGTFADGYRPSGKADAFRHVLSTGEKPSK